MLAVESSGGVVGGRGRPPLKGGIAGSLILLSRAGLAGGSAAHLLGQPKLLRLPQWRHWLPPRHHGLGDEDGDCLLSVFTLSSQYPLVKEYGETNSSHTMNDVDLVHDAPAWIVFLFLACHVYYCSTSVAVMSVIMEFNLLPPYYSSTFWLVKGTFLQCGLWRKYSTPKTLWTFICAMINKWCTAYANQIYLPFPNHRCVH